MTDDTQDLNEQDLGTSPSRINGKFSWLSNNWNTSFQARPVCSALRSFKSWIILLNQRHEW